MVKIRGLGGSSSSQPIPVPDAVRRVLAAHEELGQRDGIGAQLTYEWQEAFTALREALWVLRVSAEQEAKKGKAL